MNLSSFQNSQGLFTIAPFDHRASLAESLKLDLQKPEDQALFLELKRLFMKLLSPHVSAVLTDPEYGIQTLEDKAPSCGLFLSLEESGYSGDHDAMTTLKENWGIDGVASKGAGAKLLMYFNPKSGTATQKLELLKRVADEARQKEVVLLVEPVLYALKDQKQWSEEFDDDWIATHLEVCKLFAPHCDILKIQYPGSEAACKTVSSLHPNWILLSRGVTFDSFHEYLEIAAPTGCKGYAAGRAVWQELTSFHTKEEWAQFLGTVGVERLEDLTRTLASQYAAAS